MSIFYEMDKNFGDLLDEKKNFLFIGEAGSGKSEIVLNVAAKLAEKTGSRVQVFDMDQSKPLYGRLTCFSNPCLFYRNGSLGSVIGNSLFYNLAVFLL